MENSTKKYVDLFTRDTLRRISEEYGDFVAAGVSERLEGLNAKLKGHSELYLAIRPRRLFATKSDGSLFFRLCRRILDPRIEATDETLVDWVDIKGLNGCLQMIEFGMGAK